MLNRICHQSFALWRRHWQSVVRLELRNGTSNVNFTYFFLLDAFSASVAIMLPTVSKRNSDGFAFPVHEPIDGKFHAVPALVAVLARALA